MSAEPDFDPYYKWLGIRPDERPLHYYRLLGLTDFESDRDVIKNAADQLMAHVRTFQTGKHSAKSQEVLNQLAQARLNLLNGEKKARYDQQLRNELAPAQSPPPMADYVAPPSDRWRPAVISEYDPSDIANDYHAPRAQTVRPSAEGNSTRNYIIAGVAAAVVTLGITFGLLAFRMSQRTEPVEQVKHIPEQREPRAEKKIVPSVSTNSAPADKSVATTPAKAPTPTPPTTPALPSTSPPPQAPGTPPATAPAVEPDVLQFTVWTFPVSPNEPAGEFRKTGDAWVETRSTGQVFGRFIERERTKEYVDLFDANRSIWVRLTETRAGWARQSSNWSRKNSNGNWNWAHTRVPENE